jgi:hypothetical protein
VFSTGLNSPSIDLSLAFLGEFCNALAFSLKEVEQLERLQQIFFFFL